MKLLIEEARVIAKQRYNSPLIEKVIGSYPEVKYNGGKMAGYDYYEEDNIISTWIFEGAQDNSCTLHRSNETTRAPRERDPSTSSTRWAGCGVAPVGARLPP